MSTTSTPLLLVGTMKGAFILRPDKGRKKWEMEGPYLRGHAVYAMAMDTRAGRNKLFATAMNSHFGTVLASSEDLGKSWNIPEEPNVTFPEGSELALKQIWQIAPGPEDQPEVMYCGVEPAALFKSTDAGASWKPVQGLLDHPHRKEWQPGGGGLCLHTIVQDPADHDRMLIAISAAGAYRTDDGGKSWRASNKGVRAEFMPDKHPEFGQCVHKVVNHPSRPGRLFLQNHWGLYRSDDWGDSWQDIANGVPSDFGFAMAMHPHDPDSVYILPIEADVFRVVPEAKLRVYRTRDAGASWHPLANGLPQEDAYECVLRDAMSVDQADPAGVYFGTRSGKVFASNDEGESWQLVADTLPPVVCVKTAMISA